MGLLTGTGSSEESWNPSVTTDTTTRSYWLNWRVLLCATWIAISATLSLLLILKHERFFKRTHCRAGAVETDQAGPRKEEEQFVYEDETWRPCLEGVHPAWLLGFRAVAFSLLLLLLIANVLVEGPTIYYYYTQWTCTLIAIYFGLGLLLSIHGCFKYHNSAGGERVGNVEVDSERGMSAASTPAGNTLKFSPLKTSGLHTGRARQASGFWGYSFQILFQVNAGAVVLTDCMFWFVMVPVLMAKHYQLTFLDVNMHTINAGLLVIDAAVNHLRFPLFRIAYFFLWTVFFVMFQWILHACVLIWWPYPFLDLSSRYAPMWYLAVALMHVLCYGAFALAIKLKHYLLAKWFPELYLR